MLKASKPELYSDLLLDNQKLELIRGQRGRYLLVFAGYTFAKNNIVGETTYWCCRCRKKGHKPCTARIMTTIKPNGLYRITVTKPHHNHLPTVRMLKKFQRQSPAICN